MLNKIRTVTLVSLLATSMCYGETYQEFRSKSGFSEKSTTQKSSTSSRSKRLNSKPANKEKRFTLHMSEKTIVSVDDISANNFNPNYINVIKSPVIFYDYAVWLNRQMAGRAGVAEDSGFNRHLSFENKDRVNFLIKKHKTAYIEQAIVKCTEKAKKWIREGKNPDRIWLHFTNYDIHLTPYKDDLIMIVEEATNVTCAYTLEEE